MKYKLIRQLDCQNNGQGVIWEARTDPGDQTVALKFMKQDPSDSDRSTTEERFLREIRCQTMLQHSNIVCVLDSGTNTLRGPWYSMEWADESLRDVLVKHPGGLNESTTMRIFTSIVEAMAYAHQEGVLHRDLKPENVLFYNGVPRLSDFGLGRRLTSDSARITQSHFGLGTLMYMAPEQFSDAHAVGPAADVYSLGKILFELLTGIRPDFVPDVNKAPAKYRYILHRCLEQDPEKRFSNAGQLAQALSMVSTDASLLSPPEEQAKQALGRILAEDESALHDLAQILMNNPEDSKLYLQFLPLLPAGVVKLFGEKAPSEFGQVLMNFDYFAYGAHPWTFCDTLSDFMTVAYQATTSIASRRLLLARILELGASHHRYYVRDEFADLVEKAIKVPGYAQVVADVLRNDPQSAEFVADTLRQRSMPQVVLDALNHKAA